MICVYRSPVRHLFAGGFLFALFALAGCSDLAVTRDSPLPEGRGMVVMNLAMTAVGAENWDSVEIWSENERRVYYVQREPEKPTSTWEYTNTAFFSAALPPGSYRIDAFKTQTNGSRSSTVYTAPVGNRLGKFKVEAGRLTNLGTVLMYSESWLFRTGDFVLARISTPDTVRMLKYKNPVAFKSLGVKPELTWSDSRGIFAPNVLAQLKANLPRFHTLLESRTGELYAGGMLGQVFKRKRNGEWSTIETGTAEEILRVTEGSDGALYAMAERQLLKSSDGGQSWKELPLPRALGRLEFFSVAPDGTQHLYVYTDGLMVTGMELYSRKGDGEPWSLQIKDSFDSGLMSRFHPSSYEVSEAGRLRFMCPMGSHYELSPDGRTITREFPGYMMHVGMLPDGSYYGVQDDIIMKDGNSRYPLAFFGAGVKSRQEPYVWENTWVWGIRFRDRNNGYALTRVKKSDVNELLKTTDGGKTWQHLKAPPTGSSIYVMRGGELVASNVEGQVYVSRDDGKSWTHERGPVNVVALSKTGGTR